MKVDIGLNFGFYDLTGKIKWTRNTLCSNLPHIRHFHPVTSAPIKNIKNTTNPTYQPASLCVQQSHVCDVRHIQEVPCL